MSETPKLTYEKWSEQPSFNPSGGDTIIPLYQDDGNGKIPKTATPAQLQGTLTNQDILYEPNLTTPIAQGIDGGAFKIGERFWCASFSRERITTLTPFACNIELASNASAKDYAFDITMINGSSNAESGAIKYFISFSERDGIVSDYVKKVVSKNVTTDVNFMPYLAAPYVSGGKILIPLVSLRGVESIRFNIGFLSTLNISTFAVSDSYNYTITTEVPDTQDYVEHTDLAPYAKTSDLDVKVQTTSEGVITRTTGDVSISHVASSGTYVYTVNNATTVGYVEVSVNDGEDLPYGIPYATVSSYDNIITVDTINLITPGKTDYRHTLSFKIIN